MNQTELKAILSAIVFTKAGVKTPIQATRLADRIYSLQFERAVWEDCPHTSITNLACNDCGKTFD